MALGLVVGSALVMSACGVLHPVAGDRDAAADASGCCPSCCEAMDGGTEDRSDGAIDSEDARIREGDAEAMPDAADPLTHDAGDPTTHDGGGVVTVDAGAVGEDAWVIGDPGTCRAWPTGTIDVLFVGNSQIDVSDLPSVVSELSSSGPGACVRIAGARFTLGGANLRDLWETRLPDGRALAETIATGRYEVVVIAESIDLAEFIPAPFPALFVEYATRIISASRAAGAVPLLYATPYIDAPDRTGFHAMANPQIALGAELGVGVAAGGLAWLRVWDERPELDLHAGDHAHPGCLGTYISASVIWAAITGGNPIGLPHDIRIDSGAGTCAPISSADASLFQRAAWAQQLETGPR